jgi:hydroxyacylglutathione hydrolase
VLDVVVIDTPTLGDRSYLVHDGTLAAVVDPQRDLDRVLAAAAGAGVQITDVVETHIHNDYVSGGRALAEACGARYHVNVADDVAFRRHAVHPGERIQVSATLALRAVAAPGHTHTHLAYVLEERGAPVAVFTGGSLLYGSTGRTDLLGPEHTLELAHAQWATAHRLAADLPDDTRMYPTHGFGSFCSAGQSDVTSSSIGAERRANPVLLQAEEAWVASMLAGLDAWPAYYARMGPANRAGEAAADLSPPVPADAAELRRRIRDGEWVVDLRHRKAFCEGHVAGTLNFGLDGSLATYLAWLIPWGTPVTLLGETAADVAAAQRELARVGIDRPAAAATGGPADWLDGGDPAPLPRATFGDLAAARAREPVAVLDVRRHLEWAESHLAGAVHVPLHELQARLGALPAGRLWVHCLGGYRAAVAGSLLARAGRRVVVVDDDFGRAAVSGLPLEGAAHPPAAGRSPLPGVS